MSKESDTQLVYNLRYRWKEELKDWADEHLIDEYHNFSMSDMYGNNDEKFLEWIGIEDSKE